MEKFTVSPGSVRCLGNVLDLTGSDEWIMIDSSVSGNVEFVNGEGVTVWTVNYDGVDVSHDYSLSFGADSYVAVGGSVTLECTLLMDGVVLSGATVSLSDGTSQYSSITNTNGVAIFNVTGVSSDVTFTATYMNATATCTVKGLLFYDDCSSDQTSQYGNNVILQGSGGATLTFDTDHYVMSKTSNSDSFIGFLIPSIQDDDNIRVTFKMKLTRNSAYNQFGLWIKDNDNTSKYELMRLWGTNKLNAFINNSSSAYLDMNANTNITQSYYYFVIDINGSSRIFNIYDENGNSILSNQTATSQSYTHMEYYICMNTNSTECLIKEIKVEPL